MRDPRIFASFPRKRESGGNRTVACSWAPAGAGATKIGWVLAMLLLVGCNSSMTMPGWPKPAPQSAASASAWTRPGVDAAAVSGAYDECLSAASSATESDNDIDQDISASRGSDLQHSEFAGAQLRDAQSTSRDRTQAILSSCMERKGFTPAK